MMINISKETHRKLKVLAALRGMKLGELVEKIILQEIDSDKKEGGPL